MKLFFKRHWGIFLSEIFFLIFLLGIIYLAGFRDLLMLVYVTLLFFLFQIGLFFFLYYRQKNLWHYLENKIPFYSLKKDPSDFSKDIYKRQALDLNEKNHALKTLKEQQQKHLEFMELWVHQMKTPLSVLNLLSQEKEISPKSLTPEIYRLKEGLTLALNLSRAENFSKDFILEEINLRTLCQKAITEQKQMFIAKNIYPRLEVPDTFLITDEKWLLFICQQLLSNSLKYAKEKSQITFYTKTINQQLTLYLKDEGLGISKRDLHRVTEPFYTGENGRNYPDATGMGLYLVKTICTQLDITLHIHSQKNLGTTISLTFPKNAD